MYRFLIILSIVLTSCTANFNNEQAVELIQHLEKKDSISPEDAKMILSMLETMLSEACYKAEKELKNGTNLKNVREALSTDSTYIGIARHASILDSILLNYIDTCHNNALIRYEYQQVLKRNVRRARRAGLN